MQKIKVGIVYNSKLYSEDMSENLKFSEFKKIITDKLLNTNHFCNISSKRKINFNSKQTGSLFSFYYNNVKIPDYFNSEISELFKFSKENELPVIIAKSNSKEIKTINNNNVSLDITLPKVNQPSKSQGHSYQINHHVLNNSINASDKREILEKKFISKVSITSFPSRTEVFMLIDKFLETNNLSKQYFSENKDNEIIVKFDDTSIAFDFIKYINQIKSQSHLYSKIKTSMFLDIDRKNNNCISNGIEVNNHFSNNSNSNINFIDNTNNSSKVENTSNFNVLNNKKEFCFQNEHNNKSNKNDLRKKLINHQQYNSHNNNSSIYNHIHYTFDRNPAYIRLHSPYKPQYQLEFEDYKKNKEKWMNKKGFINHIHNVDKENYIKNFVNVSQYLGSYLNHNFREQNKHKWVIKKDFELY